MQTMKT